jgi:hypothetical protein
MNRKLAQGDAEAPSNERIAPGTARRLSRFIVDSLSQ